MHANGPLIASILAGVAAAWPSWNATNTTNTITGHSWSSSKETEYLAQLSSEVQSLREQLQTQSLACARPSGGPEATTGVSSALPPTVAGSAGNDESSTAASYGSTHQSSTISSISASLSAQSSSGLALPSTTIFGSAPGPPYPYTQSSNSSAVASAPSTGALSALSGSASSGPSNLTLPSATFTPAVTSTDSLVAGTGASSASTSSTEISRSIISTSTSTSSAAFTGVPTLSDFTDTQIESGEAWNNISSLALQRMQQDSQNRTAQACTFDNARVRTEFRSMSNADRKSFTDAILCLQSLPPQTMTESESASYPGVKNRHDEFVATHINMTYNIHMTADFLAFHRQFIYEFEKDLREQCSYTGNLPYWSWSRDAEAVDQSELFNGDEYSMGSNGEYVADRSYTYLGTQDVNFPPGTGGGCVYSGPFSNYTTNLGPIDSPYNNNNVNNTYDYNPRCLVRDLNSWFSSQYNTYTNVTELVLGQTSIGNFQNLMQGYLDDNKFGVHGGGHWLGGGPSQLEDFHSSPNDPVFFLHHANIDRIWTVWQYLDAANRLSAIEGTSTLDNSPPSAEMQLSDIIDFGFVAEPQVFGSLLDTLAGPYCYRYD